MSDDLVKRLRDLGDHAAFEPHMHHTAADHIEKLEAKLAKCSALMHAGFAEYKRRLTRAVKALELADAALSGANMNMSVVEREVKATIAELEGEIDD
jgi:hypothetical protein